MFERTFRKIDNALWKVDGCAAVLDDSEQSSLILFLKYLADFEQPLPQKIFFAAPTASSIAVDAILKEAKVA